MTVGELQVNWDDPESVEQLRQSIVRYVQGDPFFSTPKALARQLRLLASWGASWPKLAERRWYEVITGLISEGRLVVDADSFVGPAPFVEPEQPVEQLQLTWEED